MRAPVRSAMAPSTGASTAIIDAADRGRGAPERLAGDRVADDGRGEVGGEDEGDDQGLERLVRPVEQHPGEDAAAVGRRRGRVRSSGGQGRAASAALQAATQAGSARLRAGRADLGHHAVGRHDAVGPGDGAADQHRRDRLAAAEHRLVGVEEARVAADEGRADLDALEGADPAAVAHRGAGDREPPAVPAQGRDQAGAQRQRHPPEVVERQRPAVVELPPGVDVRGPAGHPGDVDPVQRQRRGAPGKHHLEAESQIGVHGARRTVCGRPLCRKLPARAQAPPLRQATGRIR